MEKSENLTILAVETSCDDTAVSIIKASGESKPRFSVLANIVSSQIEVHKKWGGVYPTLAKREHQKNLVPVLEAALGKAGTLEMTKSEFLISKQTQNPKFKALKKILKREEDLYEKMADFLGKYQKPEIDLIAVTSGPGLEPCLWVGINFAKALSYFWEIPIIAVNHIKAHIFVNDLEKPLSPESFPAVCLIVSGGHTMLFLMQDFGKYKILGETRDDAAGECFDKVAKILGLGYPGGPVIAAEAAKTLGGRTSQQLPRPMINSRDYDFSFSGLKTAVLYNFQKQTPEKRTGKKYIQEICRETQQAIIDVLVKKTLKAAKDYKAKTIILGGGVAANEELRKQFKSQIRNSKIMVDFSVPPKNLCTDNAVMTAIAGYFRYRNGKREKWQDIEANANLRLE